MYKYTGGGFIIGVPSRDLSEENFKSLSKEKQEAVKNSPYYLKLETKVQKPKKRKVSFMSDEANEE